MSDYLIELDSFEEKIISQLQQHPILRSLNTFSNPKLEDILLQKRWISLHFTPFYDIAICTFKSEEARTIAKEIVREEYLDSNHREDLVNDLIRCGLSRERIVSAKPSSETKKTVANLYQLVGWNNHYDLRAALALRIAGEVLPGEENKVILDELQRRYQLTTDQLPHYALHAAHDRKKVPFGIESSSHADRFGTVITHLVDSAEKVELAKTIMGAAYHVRADFYDQFHTEGEK